MKQKIKKQLKVCVQIKKAKLVEDFQFVLLFFKSQYINVCFEVYRSPTVSLYILSHKEIYICIYR